MIGNRILRRAMPALTVVAFLFLTVPWSRGRRLHEGHQEMLANIKEAIRIGDGPELERTTHILRGAAGNFGARRVVEVSLELETMGSAGTFDGSHEVYVRLEREMKALTDSLSGVVGREVPCMA
jgi:HPt (histidine-containing phosphotransfer) domain-containing protein